MIYFLIFTLLFWAAHSAGLFYFINMIQEGGALDTLLNYQNLLRRLYASPKLWKNYLGKVLGDCHLCTSFWSGLIMYVACRVTISGMGYWVINGFWANLIWGWMFWVTSGAISYLFLKSQIKDGM